MPDPNNDGVDHINIYSKAKTPLGRFLSNFERCRIETSSDGYFMSVEAYWYWMLSPNTPYREKLRDLSGWEAKKSGRLVSSGIDWNESDESFKMKIKQAIVYKIQNSSFKEEFVNSKLQFKHYYVYNDVVSEPENGKWLIDFFEELRDQVKLTSKG